MPGSIKLTPLYRGTKGKKGEQDSAKRCNLAQRTARFILRQNKKSKAKLEKILEPFLIMEVTVKFFALGRELVGDSDLNIELEEGNSVRSLIELLESRHPKLNELKSFLVAVNMEYADMQRSLRDGDEVAIIPPVSGG